MGRKIPGKKHRTVKDPYVQRAKQNAVFKNKINNPPSKIDEQEMPKSVLRIMELKERAKQMTQAKKRKRQAYLESKRQSLLEGKQETKQEKAVRFNMKRAMGKEVKMPGMDKPDKFVPDLQQREGESLKKFSNRVHGACNEVIREVQFEKEFGVEVKRDEEGTITQVKPTKSSKRSKKPKLSEKRRNREEKKVAGKEPEKEFVRMERVEFGDIVHEPPTISKFPGKKQQQPTEILTRRPGKTDLLLKDLLGEKDSAGKKKNLSQIEKEKIEKRRSLVVEAFRQSKRAKIL